MAAELKVTRTHTENAIEGYIYEAGFHEKSRFNYLYEIEKKILHVYDDLSSKSTGALNSFSEIVTEIDKITKGDAKGLKGLTQKFVSLFSENDPVKVIFYTEAGTIGLSGLNNFGEPLDIQGYDIRNKEFSGYTKDELHPNFVDINSVVVPN